MGPNTQPPFDSGLTASAQRPSEGGLPGSIPETEAERNLMLEEFPLDWGNLCQNDGNDSVGNDEDMARFDEAWPIAEGMNGSAVAAAAAAMLAVPGPGAVVKLEPPTAVSLGSQRTAPGRGTNGSARGAQRGVESMLIFEDA